MNTSQLTPEQVAAELKPGRYAILYRDNWDGEGDTCHLLATLNDSGFWYAEESGNELLQFPGDAILKVWPLDDGSGVLALLDALDARDKSNAFLKERLEQMANFNPDWDLLEAAMESQREHAAELKAMTSRAESAEQALKSRSAPVGDLVMLIKVLVRGLKKTGLNSELCESAMDYLKREKLISVSDCLRSDTGISLQKGEE